MSETRCDNFGHTRSCNNSEGPCDLEPVKERLYHEIMCPTLTKTGPCNCQTQIIVADGPRDDGKDLQDRLPKYSQLELDAQTKPLHAEIERLTSLPDEKPRKVPSEFSTGSDRYNAQKAWLAGFDAAVRTDPVSLPDGRLRDVVKELEALADNFRRIGTMSSDMSFVVRLDPLVERLRALLASPLHAGAEPGPKLIDHPKCQACGHQHFYENEHDSLPFGKCRNRDCCCWTPSYAALSSSRTAPTCIYCQKGKRPFISGGVPCHHGPGQNIVPCPSRTAPEGPARRIVMVECPRHGMVPDDHRCAIFDGAPEGPKP